MIHKEHSDTGQLNTGTTLQVQQRRIYQKILELVRYLFHNYCSKLHEHCNMISFIKILVFAYDRTNNRYRWNQSKLLNILNCFNSELILVLVYPFLSYDYICIGELLTTEHVITD